MINRGRSHNYSSILVSKVARVRSIAWSHRIKSYPIMFTHPMLNLCHWWWLSSFTSEARKADDRGLSKMAAERLLVRRVGHLARFAIRTLSRDVMLDRLTMAVQCFCFTGFGHVTKHIRHFWLAVTMICLVGLHKRMSNLWPVKLEQRNDLR